MVFAVAGNTFWMIQQRRVSSEELSFWNYVRVLCQGKCAASTILQQSLWLPSIAHLYSRTKKRILFKMIDTDPIPTTHPNRGFHDVFRTGDLVECRRLITPHRVARVS